MSDRSSATPAHTQDLQRAQLALQVLSRAGLGDLDWVGPGWICALGEIDPPTMDYLSTRIREDSRLRRDIRQCRSARDLRLLQAFAIGRALQEYGTTTGRKRVSVPELRSR
jgi:hypothetical protein